MSIGVMKNCDGVETGSGYSCLSMMDDQGKQFHEGDQRIVEGGGGKKMEEEMENDRSLLDSSTCSSIGKNSDDDDDDDDNDNVEEEEEVQSSYKCGNGSFDSIQALEEALPMRRGMSRFYNGKSKSFTSLTDASSSSSITEIAKPDNSYSRRRRNLLACRLVLDKNRSFQLKSSGGISKKSTKLGRTTLALAAAMSSRTQSHERATKSDSNANLISRFSQGNFISWRSFSFADLQEAPAPR